MSTLDWVYVAAVAIGTYLTLGALFNIRDGVLICAKILEQIEKNTRK